MAEKYINSVDPKFMTEDIKSFVEDEHTQAEIVKYMIEQIVSEIN